jgi:hypothetical protein
VRSIRRIAEEEYILVVLLAGFGLIFLLIFPPAIFVNDSWLNLMAGREVIENGLPNRDELTVYGLGNTWTDQQWLAQVVIYGLFSLGGHALLSIGTAALVVAAFSIAAAAARSLGAGPRAIWLLFLPVLMAAPWAWSIRAQMLALPLYTGLLWLLASEVRRPTRRVWLAFALLVVWANVHGSVALGALLVMLLGVFELVRSRGRSGLRSAALVVFRRWPCSSRLQPNRHDQLLPLLSSIHRCRAGDRVALGGARVDTVLLRALAIAIRSSPGVQASRSLRLAVLAITCRAVTAIRGIVWFALACMVFLPVAIGRRLESRKPGEPRRSFNVALTAALVGTLVVVALSSFLRPASWYETYWPREAVATVRDELAPGDKVFIPDRFSDWMLFKIPELRGRIAYDVRFEVYDREFFDRLQAYAFETGTDWKSFADGYGILLELLVRHDTLRKYGQH